MKEHELLHLASLLHDIGKFRQRATDRFKKHQEHSYEFVTEDFADYFSPCGDTLKNAVRHHHNDPTQLQHLIEKQVVLADRLSATEREDEEREEEDFVQSPLVSILSRLKCAENEHRYKLTALNFERDTVIPTETVNVNQDTYKDLWQCFIKAFSNATEGQTYKPEHYQTIVALLHKYTSRMPSATPWKKSGEKTIPDISLYDHLRTTAAIAACIGRELNETQVDEELKLLNDNIDGQGDNKDGREDLAPTGGKTEESQRNICALIKGDISGIQKFLYHILSDGAANQLRGRSFYLQLLTEAIAHWVLRQLDLPITNLLLASGGHFFILAPYTKVKKKLDELRKQISEKLWELHRGDISCMLAGISIKARDFGPKKFSDKWDAVSEKVQQRKQQKWSELENDYMFKNLFKPQEDRVIDKQENDEEEKKKKDPWRFEKLGRGLRNATTLVAFEVPESPIPDKPKWRDAIKTFGFDIRIRTKTDERPKAPSKAKHGTVYRIGDTNFLTDIEKYQWEDITVSYDFRPFHPVIAHTEDGKTADYDYLAESSEGVHWLGALQMDVDDLGNVFKNKLENATISRHATLSRELRLFFEGYVPELCRQYNNRQDKEMLELIYAGGDDLFLVGGWSALPDIAEQIRTEFRHFVTGDHITLSGGIAIEHKKFPLYQFADLSDKAEKAAKNLCRKNAECKVIEKDAICFLRKPMSWENFVEVRNWHEKFLDAVRADKQPLPSVFLTRLNQIYADKRRWAWRSLYYFSRMQERYRAQSSFLSDLQHELNHNNTFDLKGFIQVITRWTALRIRK